MISNGYFPQRCGQIQIILKPGYVEGTGVGTSWSFGTLTMRIFRYCGGWGIKHGSLNRDHVHDRHSSTVAALLHFKCRADSRKSNRRRISKINIERLGSGCVVVASPVVSHFRFWYVRKSVGNINFRNKAGY